MPMALPASAEYRPFNNSSRTKTMANFKNDYLNAAQCLATLSSAFAAATAVIVRQCKALRERFGERFVVRSGYPPHFSVPIRHPKYWPLELGKVLIQPGVLLRAVAAVGIYAGSFWLTLLFL